MGESRHNPRSQQYTGPLPDVQPGAELMWMPVPSRAFEAQIKAMREDGIEGPIRCEQKDQDVVMVAVAKWIVPQRTTNQWPTAQIPMAELARMPLIEFKQKMKTAFIEGGMPAIADTIVIPDEKLITEQ